MAEQPITRTELREELAWLREELRPSHQGRLAEVRGDIKALRALMISTISGVGLALAGLNVIPAIDRVGIRQA